MNGRRYFGGRLLFKFPYQGRYKNTDFVHRIKRHRYKKHSDYIGMKRIFTIDYVSIKASKKSFPDIKADIKGFVFSMGS